jgi:hypothetical protein
MTRKILLLFLSVHVSFSAQQPSQDARKKPTDTDSEHTVSSTDTLPHRIRERRLEGIDRGSRIQTLTGLSVNGTLEPIREIQEESVRLDAQTTRKIRRLFTRAPDGSLRMAEQTEETTRTLPGGKTRVEGTTSRVDLNGRLQPTQRQIREIENVGADVTKTHTSVLAPDINAGFARTLEIDEVERRKPGGGVEIQETRTAPNPNHSWEVRERVERVIRPESTGARTEEEQLYRRDFEGKMFLAERTVVRETKDAQGVVRRAAESSRRNAAAAPLQVDSRVRTVETRMPDGTVRTVEELEARRLDSPGEGLRLIQKSMEILRPDGKGGVEGDRQIQGLDPNGRLVVTSAVKIKETKR